MTEISSEEINVSTWKIPSPLGIIGSHSEGQFNGMTASWITQVSMEPALIGVGIDNKSVTFNLMNSSCLLYTSPSPRDATLSRMPSSA